MSVYEGNDPMSDIRSTSSFLSEDSGNPGSVNDSYIDYKVRKESRENERKSWEKTPNPLHTQTSEMQECSTALSSMAGNR